MASPPAPSASPARFSTRWAARVGAALSAAVLLGAPLAGSQEPEAAAPAPAVEPPRIIPAAEIVERARQVQALLAEIEARAEPDAAVLALADELPRVQEHIRERAPGARQRIASGPSQTVLFNIESEWLGSSERLGARLKTLGGRLQVLDADLERLAGLDEQWQKTLEVARAEGLPAPLLQRIGETRDAIRERRRAVEKRRGEVLTLQDQVAEQASTVSEVLAQVAKAREQLRTRLLRLDSPPLWTALARGRPEEDRLAALRDELADDVQVVETYARERVPMIALYGAVAVALFVALSLLRAPAEHWAEQDEDFRLSARILARPVSGTLLFALMGIPLLTSAPPLAKGLAALLLVVPALRLLTPVLERDPRRGLYAVAAWYVVSWVREGLVVDPLSARIVLLLEGLAVVSALLWLLRPARFGRLAGRRGPWLAAGGLLRLALLALATALVSNVLGNSSLAEMLTDATLASAYVAFLLFAVERILSGAYAGLLHTRPASALRAVRLHGDLLRSRGLRLIRFAAVALWVLLALGFFQVREAIFAGLASAFGTPWSIGNLELTLGELVVFGVTIWLSFLLSRFVRFALEEEMLPRASLPRGVPFAISALARYAILLLGFLVAVAAAGIDMSRIVLVIGALGVGIGIGLQGVVNNFVSGLILLFERPIQVGDTVQVGEILGLVRRIGIRSSTLRTFDGAEVVIPNARFVSDEFVNWTLSDPHRRVEVRVGVAYGTDPERVIAVLREVAKSHPEIMSDPEPMALFLGFGESSLDFQLRAWTARSDAWFRIASDLSVGVNRALREAGIEIPFPQRDLHLRSVDPRIQKRSDQDAKG